MDLARPLQALFPSADSAVFSVLAETTKPRTGRGIARLADRSQSATQRVLDRLVEQGVVSRTDAGRARVYALNREHLAADLIIDLVDLRSRLFSRLAGYLELWRPDLPIHASVFGSAARGDGDARSDIDIFLIRPRRLDEDDPSWRGRVGALGDFVFLLTGNHAGIAELGENEVVRLRSDQPAVVSAIRDEAVDLVGIPARELLRRP